ncbi:MAG: FHA domain-containing protein [Anaerolineaceae bacterium]|nr:FHA domain-containing protein [Anaerolineaceae bacterium]
MENRLDFVEEVLKRFFERFTGTENEWKRQLLTRVLNQMTLNAIPHDDGYSILPDIIKVYVSAKDETMIPEVQKFIHHNMPDILVQLAAEDMITHNDPMITFSTDDTLESHEMSVSAIPPDSGIEDTAVLTVSPIIPKKGAFISKAYLLFPDGREYLMDQPIINIGRNPENHLILDFATISRHHAQIRMTNGVHHIFDVQSTSGTCINDVKIEHGILNSGDVIRFADIQFIYVTEISQPGERSLTDDDTQEIL